MSLVAIGGTVCEMDDAAIAVYKKTARWLEEVLDERDALREQLATATENLTAARAAIKQLTTCDCGEPLSPGKCGYCDNDE